MARTYAYDGAGRITASVAKAEYSPELKDLLSTGTEDLTLTEFRPTRPSDYGWASFEDAAKRRVPHNRLEEYDGLKFKYDDLGRTIEKTDQNANTTWLYKYNCENQLTEVLTRSPRGFIRTAFTYDALGRWVAKSDGKNDGKTETRFVWNGLQLLQEERAGVNTTYVYEQDSYVPLARMDVPLQGAGAGMSADKAPVIYYFHCNAAGQPEELTDVNGEILWRARYSV